MSGCSLFGHPLSASADGDIVKPHDPAGQPGTRASYVRAMQVQSGQQVLDVGSRLGDDVRTWWPW